MTFSIDKASRKDLVGLTEESREVAKKLLHDGEDGSDWFTGLSAGIELAVRFLDSDDGDRRALIAQQQEYFADVYEQMDQYSDYGPLFNPVCYCTYMSGVRSPWPRRAWGSVKRFFGQDKAPF